MDVLESENVECALIQWNFDKRFGSLLVKYGVYICKYYSEGGETETREL